MRPAPAPEITEYQRVSKVCSGCGAVSTPGWDETGDECAEVVGAPGSPVPIGPRTLARAVLLTCGHYLPVGRSRALLVALTGIDVSTGFLAGVRGRAARKLERTFLPYLRGLLSTAPVLHADETTGRAAGALSYVHVACTEYLTVMHVGGPQARTTSTPAVCCPASLGSSSATATPATPTSPPCTPGVELITPTFELCRPRREVAGRSGATGA